MSNYSKGVRWGKKIFGENLKNFGMEGIHKSDKATRTCADYVSGKRKKNNIGKKIDSNLKQFYRGVVDGMNEAYRDLYKD